MKPIALLGSVTLVLSLAGSAGATVGDNEVYLSTTLDKSCKITGPLVGSIPPTVGIHTVGKLGFKCNYTGTAKVFMSTDHGTVLINPADPNNGVQYLIRWLVTPGMPWMSSSNAEDFDPWFPTTGSPANAVREEDIQVRLIDPLTYAGTYTDIVTFTISPI